jgi:hypothetical protein
MEASSSSSTSLSSLFDRMRAQNAELAKRIQALRSSPAETEEGESAVMTESLHELRVQPVEVLSPAAPVEEPRAVHLLREEIGQWRELAQQERRRREESDKAGRGRLEALQKTIDRLRLESAGGAEEAQRLAFVVESLNDKASILQRERDAAKKEASDARRREEDVWNALRGLRRTILSLDSHPVGEVRRWLQELDDSSSRKELSQSEMLHLARRVVSLETQAEEATSRASGLMVRVSEMERMIEAAAKAERTATEMAEKERRERVKCERTVERLQAQAAPEADTAELQRALLRATSKTAEAESMFRDLQAKLEATERSHDQDGDVHRRLRERCAELEAQCAELKTRCAELEASSAGDREGELYMALDEADVRIERLLRSNRDAERECQELRRVADEASSKHEEAERRLRAATQEVSSLKKLHHEMRRAANRAAGAADDFESRLRTKQAEVDRAEALSGRLSGEVERLERALQGVRSERDALGRQVEQLTISVKTEQQHSLDLQQQVDTLAGIVTKVSSRQIRDKPSPRGQPASGSSSSTDLLPWKHESPVGIPHRVDGAATTRVGQALADASMAMDLGPLPPSSRRKLSASSTDWRPSSPVPEQRSPPSDDVTRDHSPAHEAWRKYLDVPEDGRTSSSPDLTVHSFRSGDEQAMTTPRKEPVAIHVPSGIPVDLAKAKAIERRLERNAQERDERIASLRKSHPAAPHTAPEDEEHAPHDDGGDNGSSIPVFRPRSSQGGSTVLSTRTSTAMHLDNQKRLRNALSHVLLAAPGHRNQLRRALEALDSSGDVHVVVAFLGGGEQPGQFLGLYAMDEENRNGRRIFRAAHAPAPADISRVMILSRYKYDTASRMFQAVSSTMFTPSTDAVGLERVRAAPTS